MRDQIPTGLPEEPNPLDPTPNVDVLDPGGLADENLDDDTEMQDILAPGFGNAMPEPSY